MASAEIEALATALARLPGLGPRSARRAVLHLLKKREGALESLRRFKDLVDDVRNGMECGIAVKQYNDVKVNDQIECFDRIEVARIL